MNLTEQLMREFLGDESAEDNPARLECTFTPEDHAAALTACARDFNSVQPLVYNVNANELPTDTNMFFNGTAYHLYRRGLDKLRRNDLTYKAGGVEVSFTATQIAHFEKTREEYKAMFIEEAAATKLAINLQQAYGTY